MKQVPVAGLIPVGGSALAASFLEQGLMDELRIILTPIVLGGGTTGFEGIKKRYPLRLLSTRRFTSALNPTGAAIGHRPGRLQQHSLRRRRHSRPSYEKRLLQEGSRYCQRWVL